MNRMATCAFRQLRRGRLRIIVAVPARAQPAAAVAEAIATTPEEIVEYHLDIGLDGRAVRPEVVAQFASEEAYRRWRRPIPRDLAPFVAAGPRALAEEAARAIELFHRRGAVHLERFERTDVELHHLVRIEQAGGGSACLGGVCDLRLGRPVGLDRLESDLNRVVSVAGDRLDLQYAARPRLHDRYRVQDAVLAVDLGHSDFFA